MHHSDITNAQRAEVLVQAMPNIRRYYRKIVVIKYGGNAMINEDLKQQVMQDIVLLSLIGARVVLVHGGGPEISDLMKRLGKEADQQDPHQIPGDIPGAGEADDHAPGVKRESDAPQGAHFHHVLKQDFAAVVNEHEHQRNQLQNSRSRIAGRRRN